MAQYKVLARKYRPKTFEDLIGQEHITISLNNAFKMGQFPQTILLNGRLGSGKTSAARIIAAMLNCKEGPTLEPCGECDACKAIFEGAATDVREIDGASNRGIDKTRELKEEARFAPMEMRKKIFIIDEVHMLTTEAFNSLLKLVEEPPSNLYIIMCTTDPEKMPETVISRCQRYNFKKISHNALLNLVKSIAKEEKIDCEEEALSSIVRLAEGSARNAIKSLESARNFSDGKVTVEDINRLFGTTDRSILFDLADKIIEKNATEGIIIINDLVNKGVDLGHILKDFSLHFRNLLIKKTCKTDAVFDLTEEQIKRLGVQASKLGATSIVEIFKLIERTINVQVYNISVQHMLESLFIEAIIILYKKDKEDKT